MQSVAKLARGERNVGLREVEPPRPGPGQVLLAVRAAGICGTDLHIYHDEYADATAGGAGTRTRRRGRGHRRGCHDVRCRATGSQPRPIFTSAVSVGFAAAGSQTSVRSDARSARGSMEVLRRTSWCRNGTCTGCRRHLTFQEAALTEPLACVVHGALELPKVTAGDVAVIAGPGAIGLLTLQAVRAAGAAVSCPGHAGRSAVASTWHGNWALLRAIDVTAEDPAPVDPGADRWLGSGYCLGVLWCGDRGPSVCSASRAARRAIRPDRALWQTGGLGSRSGLLERAARHRQ